MSERHDGLGAYEGWLPSPDSIFGHIGKRSMGWPGSTWPGNGPSRGRVPMALMSGRQMTQLICADERRPFLVPVADSSPDPRLPANRDA